MITKNYLWENRFFKVQSIRGALCGLACLGWFLILDGCYTKNDCDESKLLHKVKTAIISEIEACLTHIENIDYQDLESNSALSLAIARGDEDIFREIIAAGPDPLINGPGDVSMARLVKIHENHGLLLQLKHYQLRYWENLDGPFTRHNLTTAIEQDNTLILQRFIDRGFAMNAAVVDSITPLVLATLNGSAEVVDLLLNLGVDPDSEFDTRAALSVAAMFGYTDIAKMLIDANADVDNYDGTHTTALMFAAENNHLPIAKMLLDAGASVKMYDKNRETALDKAQKKGYYKIVELLLAQED